MVAALLWARAAASESQWDSAHLGLCHAMRGVSGDRAPLRAMEVLLCYRAIEEEGEEEEAGPGGADGICEHPSSRQPVIGVHVHPVVEVQQGVA